MKLDKVARGKVYVDVSRIATDDTDFDRATWLWRHWVFNAPAPAS